MPIFSSKSQGSDVRLRTCRSKRMAA